MLSSTSGYKERSRCQSPALGAWSAEVDAVTSVVEAGRPCSYLLLELVSDCCIGPPLPSAAGIALA